MCLFLGGLTWWWVSAWLVPIPLWSKHITPFDTFFWPLAEDAEGKYLLAFEGYAKTGPTKKQNLSLAILDQLNGNVLYEVKRTYDGEFEFEEEYLPRFINQSVWRLRHSAKQEVLELRRWRFLNNASEEKVQQWPYPHDSYYHASWSANNETLMLRFSFRFMPLLLASNPIHLAKCFWFAVKELREFKISWYETWKIPAQADQKPTMFARWTPHWSRWEGHAKLSPDGRWAALSDSDSSHHQWLKTLAGKQTLQGSEILWSYFQKPYGCLIYDAATGKQISQLHDPEKVYLNLVWYRDNLLIHGSSIRADFKIDVDHLVSKTKTEGDQFHRLRHDANVAFVFLDGKATSIQISPIMKENSFPFAVVNDELVVIEGGFDTYAKIHICDIMDMQLCSKEYDTDAASIDADSYWIHRKSKQLVSRLPPAGENVIVSKLRKWTTGWPRLQSLLPDPHLTSDENRTIVIEPTTSSIRSFLIEHRCCNFGKPSLKHLYIVREQNNQMEGDFPSDLDAYALPLAFYSPWWAISAGIAITLLLWFLLTYRCRVVCRLNDHR